MIFADGLTPNPSLDSAQAFFLGPRSENAATARQGFTEIVNHWIKWRTGLFVDPNPTFERELEQSPQIAEWRCELLSDLKKLCEIFDGETPTYTPRYFGHMVSEISLPALFGHFIALLHNPNNTSKDVSKVGSRLESEAIAMLAKMVGFDADKAEGHFTSGGTIANFEAIWRARYRMDHAIALCLAVSERERKGFDPFRAAHIGWRCFDELALKYSIPDKAMRNCSAVVGNPYDVATCISQRSETPYRGPILITPASKHYSWRKSANIFGLGEEAFVDAPLDRQGRMDTSRLADLIEHAKSVKRPIMAIVSVAGTTEAGTVDPIDEVCDLLDHYRREGIHIWHHVDAAFGGFFTSTLGAKEMGELPAHTQRALSAIRRADSVTLDPHKLGYVPYACGAFIVPNHRNYVASEFQAPYIERSADNDKWRGTIEGSRPATGAAGTWLTGKTIGFDDDHFGRILNATIHSRKAFAEAIVSGCPVARTLDTLDTNILCFSLAKSGEPVSISNQRTHFVFEAFAKDPDFAISKTVFSSANYDELIKNHVERYDGIRDTTDLVMLRCVFMNPFLSDEVTSKRLRRDFVSHLNRHVRDADHRIYDKDILV